MADVGRSGGASESIVVVGASLAGLRTAEALRRRGYRGGLTLVEKAARFPPVDRPPLSKEILLGRKDVDEARLRVRNDLEAEVVRGTVTGLDLGRRTLRLEGGEEVGFDGLVIASGASPIRPAALRPDLPGVHVLRTGPDSVKLHAALARSRSVAIVGGGFIGCEVGAVCRSLGLEVTIVERAALMERVLGREIAGAMTEMHRARGCRIETGKDVVAVLGEERAESLLLADGTDVEADVVLLAVGATPNVDWLQGSGLEIGDGVLVDQVCMTAASEDVVAVGDVACWFNPLYGEHMRVEHWTNAVEQADVAAAALLEGREAAPAFASAPYVWSDQYDTKLQFVGRPSDEVEIVEGSLEEGRFVALYRDSAGVRGALCVNSPRRLRPMKQLVLERGGG